ncbi:MAG TPA: hypothetical protein PLM93_00800 [Sulfuricurvum sp.]|nr:MAG: hypothetical protein B7Y30_10080 [Campylobacterales bacterium 16-40-21]OZA03775.1 MAG: hypothetical protein B7X89_03645 [Sulfuricurvum sp. 17-40-25]HQS65709.1 hypothetical protein [Sulfuricurvum sp.]HQT37287.1 hypothetical protein [Sulfuricurvum sp.]
MTTLEMKKFGDFNKDDVFRISIVTDDLEILTNEDLRSYKNLTSIVLENNQNLKKIDLRGNESIKYLCLGTCDNLTEINIDQTNINNIDLYDLVSLQSIEMGNTQLLNLKNLISENITKQFLYIEDAILESFDRRIKATDEGDEKNSLIKAYEEYLESSD